MTIEDRAAMRTNWAGNITFHAARHSFNDVAGTPGELICLAAFEQQPNIDLDRNQITVSAGSTYGEVGQLLHERGYALANMASLPHVTIAGACATATHGSGDDRGNLATAISALEFVAANGDVVSISREHDADKLCGLAVGLGGFGAITSVTLNVVPAFSMQQGSTPVSPFPTCTPTSRRSWPALTVSACLPTGVTDRLTICASSTH